MLLAKIGDAREEEPFGEGSDSYDIRATGFMFYDDPFTNIELQLSVVGLISNRQSGFRT